MFTLWRAIFWIGLVWVFVPHEPDIGLGRPHVPAIAWADKMLTNWNDACGKRATFCISATAIMDKFVRQTQTRSLAQVKAEIDASIRSRARRAQSEP